LDRYGNIRVDTHSSNCVMQALLARLGYTRCGVIRLSDGTPRDAFQKVRPGR
jgi:RimJ/RimL family protein N-acetyltransferase